MTGGRSERMTQWLCDSEKLHPGQSFSPLCPKNLVYIEAIPRQGVKKSPVCSETEKMTFGQTLFATEDHVLSSKAPEQLLNDYFYPDLNDGSKTPNNWFNIYL